MNKRKLMNKISVITAMLMSFSAFSEMVAITNTTVYTGTDKGILVGVNVVLEDGKIVAFNPPSLEVDRTVDGQGRILTPGFIASLNQLGLIEVGAVKTSRDEKPKKGGAGFDASTAFNPETSLIPFARKGGITHSVVTPGYNSELFSGLTFNVELSSKFESVETVGSSVVAYFGGSSSDSRASNFNELAATFDAQVKKMAKDDSKDDGKEPTVDEMAINRVLAKEIPLIAYASRPSDILQLIKLKEKYGIKLAIAGASGAVKVKQQLAKANVTVIIGGVDNLPGDFDSLDSSLKNAGELDLAGVKVIFANSDSHLIKNLRFEAGNAISYGMSVQGALAALTKNPASIFGFKGGTVEVGQPANLVLWSGDPFEISSKVEMLWIEGNETSTDSRQDKLRERYISTSDKREAYIK
ncbi:amidohydrolase family protein [Psychrosphaera sp. 1_MG-2023]|uniref:amidohydrolase family protein n=1 Tax=Psychrosphaera sp. 1_MG-2023 TaxID=3062643 RepID=UPI0026E144BE|nr:amidohydrolase family protein [Psychrosphaera sp. 1_MG-2023]MDO6721569.1 amidohydrolase family protein [Psychrosphaera sp. 1_MG-2023]